MFFGLYATFDHPLLKLGGLDGIVKLWREYEPAAEGPEYLFFDEIQFTRDWQTWLKHQVDFEKRRRVTLFEWTPPQFARVSEEARPLVAHFHEYLLRGGFPQCALMPSVDLAQKLLRDDIPARLCHHA